MAVALGLAGAARLAALPVADEERAVELLAQPEQGSHQPPLLGEGLTDAAADLFWRHLTV